MARITVDFDKLMITLLNAAVTPEVYPSLDVHTITEVPIVLQQGFNGHMISNGYPSAGWEWTLALTLLTDDLVTGGDLADEVYQAVHGMEHKSVAGVGAVASVEDDSMFTRGPAAVVDAKSIVQYDATFIVRVRPLQAV